MFKKHVSERGPFQVFYLKRKNEAVEILEVEEIDLQNIKKHIDGGESVFITPKLRYKIN
jgi:hypothetical protein